MSLIGRALVGASTSLRWESLPPLWLVVLVIVPATFFLVRFFYRRETGRVGRRMRLAMGLLRVAAILLVLVALWGPYTETVETEPFKRHLIIAIDTSKSMGTRDDYANSQKRAAEVRRAAGYPETVSPSRKTRIEIVRDILGADRAYLEELARTFRLHIYTFDSATAGLFELRDNEDPKQAAERLAKAVALLRAEGEVTRIGTAIRDLVRVFNAKNEPVSGILMFTDGRHTGGAPDPVEEAARAAEAAGEGIAIYPVAIGNPDTAVNISVTRIDAPEVVLAGDEVSFTVHLQARGIPPGTSTELRATVIDAAGREDRRLPIDSPPFLLPAAGETKRVTFRHVFQDKGTFNLRIGVPPTGEEAIKSDNFRTHVLKVVKLKMRVLLVASKPSYTYRFLSEALYRAEKTIRANVLLLSAESEWPQPSSRGTESIPVFPQTPGELAKFDVVILLDANPGDPRIAPGGDDARIRLINNIEHWVKQGGGLILQAGRDSYIPDRYLGTAMMGLLPVVPLVGLRDDVYQEIVQLGEEKRFKLTRAGVEHPVMHVLRDPDPERVKDFWDGNDYATFYYWYAPVVRAKSSAIALALRRDPLGEVYRDAKQEPQPVLAIQPYGLGKVLWIGTDELWRMRKLVNNLYYWRFWSGAIRHLATYRLLGGNKRIKIWVDRNDGHYRIGDSVDVEAKFLDTNFEPVTPPNGDWARFTKTIKLRTPSGEERDKTLYAVHNDPPEGLFRARLVAGEKGTYRLIAEPDNDEEPAEATFVVEDFSIENLNPMLDLATLQRIAKQSRGKVLAPDRFRDLIRDQIVKREGFTRTGKTKRDDLWDSSFVLWLFVALLAVEWILRRLNLLL